MLGLRVPLEDEVVLGRDPGCAVPAPGRRRVAPPRARRAGRRRATSSMDLGSTNGTFVNGRRGARSHRLARRRPDPARRRSSRATSPPATPAGARARGRSRALARRDRAHRAPEPPRLRGGRSRARWRGRRGRGAARGGRARRRPLQARERRARPRRRRRGARRGRGARRARAPRGRPPRADRRRGVRGAAARRGPRARRRRSRSGSAPRIAAAPVAAGGRALAVTVSLGCAALAPGEDGRGAPRPRRRAALRGEARPGARPWSRAWLTRSRRAGGCAPAFRACGRGRGGLSSRPREEPVRARHPLRHRLHRPARLRDGHPGDAALRRAARRVGGVDRAALGGLLARCSSSSRRSGAASRTGSGGARCCSSPSR